MLLLHGGLGGYDQGIQLARAVMPDRYRFVAVSRPGYLGTQIDAGRTPEEQADLCAEVLDALGESKAIVAAISAGGPIALQFALRHPPRCRALVMISACSERLYTRVPPYWWLISLLMRVPMVTRRIRCKIEKDPEGTARGWIHDDEQRALILDDPDSAALYKDLRLSMLDRFNERQAGIANDIRFARAEMPWPLEHIAAPVLIVHGTADNVVPFAQAESLARNVKHAELVAIQGAQHTALFSHRRQIVSRMNEFLDAVAD